MSRALSIDELADLAATTEDQTETQVAGDYERVLIPAGVNFARLIEYIELGKQPQKPYQGKDKPPAEMVRLTFELLHPKKLFEYEKDGVTIKTGHMASVTIKKSISDKAAFKKLFNAMLYGRDGIKHMAKMLNEVFLVNVVHNVSKGADGKEVTYANLRTSDGAWTIGAPHFTDPVTEVRTDIKALTPPATQPIRLFLWANPTKETWDSLFIDGTREVKDDKGNVTQVSKNWLQERILSATDYAGSALQQLLHGVSDLPLESGVEELDEIPFDVTEPAKDGKPAVPGKVAAASANDALAALGLV